MANLVNLEITLRFISPMTNRLSRSTAALDIITPATQTELHTATLSISCKITEEGRDPEEKNES